MNDDITIDPIEDTVQANSDNGVEHAGIPPGVIPPGAKPSAYWLAAYRRGLVRGPYKDPRTRPKLGDLITRVKYEGTTEDILRAMGRPVDDDDEW